MIVWINGAFGVGKSSVAEALCKRIENSYVYDPEEVGFFLWDCFPDEMKRKGDFQDMPIWREFNRKILRHISENFAGVVIVPMTVYVGRYFDDIVGGLRSDGVEVRHFILQAARHTIIERLVARGDEADGWAAQRVDGCVKAFETEVRGDVVNTDGIGIDGVVSCIVDLLGLGYVDVAE